jgi:hypothetical protein
MKVLIKKSVLDAYLRENKSSRGDTIYNNTTGFYGNFGSVKSYDANQDNENDEDEEDEFPIEPSAQMAVQLSVDEPPVDDPDFIPVTVQELCLAASRIAKEVPSEKIEYFYRKLHKLLDAALDEKDKELFTLEEAIDYSKIHPMHHRAIQDLIAQVSGGKDRKGRMSKEDSANFVMQNRVVKKYPDITLADIIDEIEKLTTEEEEESEEAFADAVDDQINDVIVNPPGDLEDLSPPETKKVTKKRKTIQTKKVKKPASSYTASEDVDEKHLDQRAQDELNDLMASAYSEYTEMEEFSDTWDWSNYQEEAPYLRVIFDLIKILHQISYRTLQAKYITKYGGYIYDPEADVGGKTKGGFVLLKQGPTSRPQAEAMLRLIYSDFGLTYETMMRQQNILKMDMVQLTEIIERAMIGIFQKVPKLYAEFMTAVQQDMNNRKIEGTVEEVSSEAFSFISQVLAHKYKGESGKLDRDLVNVAVAGIFKRCLLDLPIDLGLQPNVSLSLDSLGKKKTSKGDKTYGFNLAAAMKRFEKLRKDPKIAKEIKKQLPALILGKITETKTAKVTLTGTKYNFEDKSTGLGYTLKASELKKKIKDYVDARLKGTQPSFDEEAAEVETDLQDDVYDPDVEEKEAKERLSKDDFETRKIVTEMEKMISSGDWMHIAPLFGFSGAPGVRQWYLRYPERKFMIMTAARSDKSPAGAKRYLEVFREMRENLGYNLITMDPKTPGILDLMIDEIANKGSLSTSDQSMIGLLEEMKEGITDLLNFYDDFDSYEQAEEEQPEKLKELSNTPGGSLLRFGIGAVFDKIIKDMDKEWHAEMKAYLETKNGLKEKDANDLAYYFTGLKNKPSKGDFSEDKSKLSNAAEAFVNVGMQAKEFFDALRYSQGWFFSTLDRELQKSEDDNYFKMVKDLTSQKLYKKDNKGNLKLNKPVYSKIKKLIDGKNGAVASYLDQLAIEEFQQETQKKTEKIRAEKPEIFK